MELLPNNSTKSKTSPALAGDVLLHIATRYDVIFGRIMLIVGDIKNCFLQKPHHKTCSFYFLLVPFFIIHLPSFFVNARQNSKLFTIRLSFICHNLHVLKIKIAFYFFCLFCQTAMQTKLSQFGPFYDIMKYPPTELLPI